MLVDFKSILERAQKGGFAIPAFNVYNMETVMGAIAAAEEAHAPVILQAYSRLFHNEEGYFLAPIVLAAAQQASVPVCFHIDHGAGEFEVTRALRYGVSGAMIDASALPYEENVALTRRVVETAAAVGVQVEGELGHIGSVNDNAMDEFTNPAQAADFAQKTGVAALAVLVGNAHGRYKKPPKLDIARIAEICEATGHLPLVLHGGTGIPADALAALNRELRDSETIATRHIGLRNIAQRLALLFTARHKPGQLAAALDQIGARGFNMECIKSRPLPHVPFEYYFYVQIVCPAGSTGAGCQTLLDTLTSVCSTLRLLGAFTLDSTEK